ncbi:MAG: hypothetical protein IJ752_01235 [Alphaproteobacteria bacterium]|nr:hypothetical protein [Alphaproteobacteria bacterium]
MKKGFYFGVVLSLLTAAGCVSENAADPNGGKPTIAAKPEAVIRSGRKDPLLKSDYVLSVLGEPSVKRYEKPSEVWVYAQTGCVLFIYMNDQEDGSKLVRHMEIGTPTFKARHKNSLPCLRTAAKLR